MSHTPIPHIFPKLSATTEFAIFMEYAGIQDEHLRVSKLWNSAVRRFLDLAWAHPLPEIKPDRDFVYLKHGTCHNTFLLHLEVQARLKGALEELNPRFPRLKESNRSVSFNAVLLRREIGALLSLSFLWDKLKDKVHTQRELTRPLEIRAVLLNPQNQRTLEKVKSLSLHSFRVGVVLEEVFAFRGLTALDLSRNFLVDLPEALYSMTQLERLNLEDNLIPSENYPKIARGLSDLPNLSEVRVGKRPNFRRLIERECDLGYALRMIWRALKKQQEDLPEMTRASSIRLELRSVQRMKMWSDVHELALPSLGLTQLPCELFCLTALKTLNLRRNQLSEIPAQISKLCELRLLNIEKNPICPENYDELRARLNLCPTLRRVKFHDPALAFQPKTPVLSNQAKVEQVQLNRALSA